MKVLVFVVLTVNIVGVKGQAPIPGPVNRMMETQGNQLMPGQGIMPNQGLQMVSGQGPQMPGQVNLLPAVMGTQGLMPKHMGPIYNQLYPQRHNRFSSNYMSQNGVYGNQKRPNQGEQSAMSLIPFVIGGDKGRRFAMMNMMMNPKQGMNSMTPWLLMDGGMDGGMWPLIAMTNNRRSKINPLMMMAAGGMM